MTESADARLARMETKLDAWMDRQDERHANTCHDVRCLQDDVQSLKESRNKVIGAAMIVGTVMGAMGSKVWALFGGK